MCGAQVPGGVAGGATPVPIPNTEVKPSRVDGTVLVTVRESRSLPGVNIEGRHVPPLDAFLTSMRSGPGARQGFQRRLPLFGALLPRKVTSGRLSRIAAEAFPVLLVSQQAEGLSDEGGLVRG
jgi:hypothetical protein